MNPSDDGWSTTYRVNVAGSGQDATVNIAHSEHGHGDWIYLGNFDIGPMTSSRQHVSLLGEYWNTDGSEGTFLEADAVKLVPTFAPSGYFSIRYIHSDHLGTPHYVTDDAGQVIWSATYLPFGEAITDEDPDGDHESYNFNIRFPGQYFDAESGLHYNYLRDYDPTLGRYIESDPIGLLGGLTNYAYVGSNPILRIDPTGEDYYVLFGRLVHIIHLPVVVGVVGASQVGKAFALGYGAGLIINELCGGNCFPNLGSEAYEFLNPDQYDPTEPTPLSPCSA
jgi:RHS repeat-associated protein